MPARITVKLIRLALLRRARTSFLPAPLGKLCLSRSPVSFGKMIAEVARQVGNVTLLVSPEREIYVLTDADAVLASQGYSSWLVGCYTGTVEAADIAGDLRIRQHELRHLRTVIGPAP